MASEAPSTPAEALEISRALRLAMNTVCKSAELLRYWDYPYRKAATAFEEMSLLDKFYWVYKCRRPVMRAEQGESIDALICRDPRSVGLPDDFEEECRITFGAVGDLIPSQDVDGSRDRLYENVADIIFDQTISYANLESPLTAQAPRKEVISDKESPVESCSREQFEVLKGHRGRNFSVMHTAGNHMFDLGAEGLETTRQQLAGDGIVEIGTNADAGQRGAGRIIEAKGVRVGFASATFGLNGRDLPAGEDYRINVARMLPKHGAPDLAIVRSQIEHCRDERCDFIVASLHWGYEFEFFPRRKQIELARTIVEWGADALIAHHPHVVQPVEYYRTRRDPDRVAVIAYSLGSLVWAYYAPHLALSAVLNFTIAKGLHRGRTKSLIAQAAVTPVFRDRVAHDGSTVIRIEKLADHIASEDAGVRTRYLSEIRRYARLALDE